jgi:cyclomaltodextrinase
LAGIYYGDEIGLNGGEDPNNREPFPWHDESTWNKELYEFTSQLMKIKNTHQIFKYGNFELVEQNYDLVIFKRKLQGEALLCIFNKNSAVQDIKIPSTAHKINKVYGDSSVMLSNNTISIEQIDQNSGLIISEQ